MNTSTTDGGRIRLGGGFRLPATSKITLGSGVSAASREAGER